jgi:transcriptional regulator with XRE-family HTH domain
MYYYYKYLFMDEKSYNHWVSMSDKALAENLGSFIKHHRLNQNKTQEEVSAAASISRSTLSLLERGETVTLNTFIKVLRVLDLLYIMDNFEVKQEISPIEYARLKKNIRLRARNQNDQVIPKNKPTW